MGVIVSSEITITSLHKQTKDTIAQVAARSRLYVDGREVVNYLCKGGEANRQELLWMGMQDISNSMVILLSVASLLMSNGSVPVRSGLIV
jgi:hypothetical protein